MTVHADTMLRTEVERFGYAFQLTPREREILTLLVAGHGTVPMIAEHLGLSTNTVHNHFKNIFKRTSTNTKTGLMALFIEHRLDDAPALARRVPHVMLVEPSPIFEAPVREGLEQLGMRVYVEVRASRVIDRVHELGLDALVVDPWQYPLEGDGPVALVENLYGGHPKVLYAWARREPDHSGPMNRGHELPRDLDGLALAVLAHCAHRGYARSRALRLPVGLAGTLVSATAASEKGEPSRSVVRILNLSPGGAFLAWDGAEALPAGARVTLEFGLDVGPPRQLQFGAEVVWTAAGDGGAEGMGVRFCDGQTQDRQAVLEYCRGRIRREAS